MTIGLRLRACCRALRYGVLVACGTTALFAAEPVAPTAPDTVIYPHRPASAVEAMGGHDAWSRLPWLMGALLLAALGTWWLWQSRGRAGALKRSGRRKLAVEETHSLGSRQYLVVASYEDKKLLLGITPGRIKLLCELSGDEETES